MPTTLQREHSAPTSELWMTQVVLYTLPPALREILDVEAVSPRLEHHPESLPDGVVRIEPRSDGGRLLTCALDEARDIECLLDASGRPLSIEDRRPFSRLSVEFEYDEDGRLQSETMIQFVADQLRQGLQAEHTYGRDGLRQSVAITDLAGRSVEVRSFDDMGRLDELHTVSNACQLSCQERFQYGPRGLLESSYRQRFAPSEPERPLRDWAETREYCPDTGNLLRRTLVERKNDAEPDETPAWTTVTVEVIDYDPEQEGVPLRDETQYLDRGPFGDPVLCKRILMNYRMIDPEGVEAIQVIDEDLRSGELRERWRRSEG